jgi:glycosyltransferase involved in cell wall biosynthesis
MVSSSRYEGFPNVVLESIALGKPVLATNCPGGTAEIVIPNLTGWLTSTEDTEAMSENLSKAIREFSMMDSQNIINTCVEKFSHAKIIGQYEKLIHHSCNSCAPAS